MALIWDQHYTILAMVWAAGIIIILALLSIHRGIKRRQMNHEIISGRQLIEALQKSAVKSARKRRKGRDQRLGVKGDRSTPNKRKSGKGE